MLRVAKRFCRGNWDEAQDVVQDALIRGYRSYLEGQFEPGSNSRAWLLKILTNAFLNTRRKADKRRADLDVEAAEQIATRDQGDMPEGPLLQAVLDEPLQRALSALPEGQRLCVVLVDIEGMDYAEAATALEVPIGTVRSRLARARIQLYELLHDFAKERRLV